MKKRVIKKLFIKKFFIASIKEVMHINENVIESNWDELIKKHISGNIKT